jgi:hypothetical protein
VFAESYEQHQRNVVRWRQIENDRKDAPPPVAQTPAAPAASTAAPANAKSPAPAPTTSSVTITPPNPPAAAVAAPAPAPEPAATFVAPAQVPLPPVPPPGLRDGSAGASPAVSDQNFDLTTTKTIPKLN